MPQIAHLTPRKKKKPASKAGPLYADATESLPYDYIVIIDAGSKGSRVFVYSWLNPSYALQNGYDLTKKTKFDIRSTTTYLKREADSGEKSSIAGPIFDRRSTTTYLKREDDSNEELSAETKLEKKSTTVYLKREADSEGDVDPAESKFGKRSTTVYLRDEDNEEYTPASIYDKRSTTVYLRDEDNEEHNPESKFDKRSTTVYLRDEDNEEYNPESKFDKRSTTVYLRDEDSEEALAEAITIQYPQINSHKKWHTKIRPGISSFDQSPQKIGKHHMKPLLQLAASVVPKSQHSRTPIFLHSTAGMRLLTPTQQNQIIDNICSYISTNSDFYMPDCYTHINVLSGDEEGLYGWLSINYLKGSLDFPQDHVHGKNHSTYGLLDMGGASTQVVFQPNSTEIDEHLNNLYKINLGTLPQPKNDNKDYNLPGEADFNVFSSSFLGFGMYQAHSKYLKALVDDYKAEHNIVDEGNYYSKVRSPITDPCLPKGYTSSAKIMDVSFDFTGESNFERCMKMIFPVLSNSTLSVGTGNSENCKQFSEENQVSSCLLNDLIPAFDFDVNHFIGVSGYWDAIKNLLSYEKDSDSGDEKTEEDIQERDFVRTSDWEFVRRSSADNDDNDSDVYDYKLIYSETSKVCSQTFRSLIELNSAKKEKHRLEESDLAELCFKSSWILNFLHLGLGFPRFGIDEIPNQNKQFKSLELVEKLEGSTFSWTLGRAVLYANDEYIQAYNNYTKRQLEGESVEEAYLVKRPGFFYSASSNSFHYGAEQSGVSPRPLFIQPSGDEKFHYYDYETSDSSNKHESKWSIQPHRWQGIAVFMILSGFIVWLMVGIEGRRLLFGGVKRRVSKTVQWAKQATGQRAGFQYTHVAAGQGSSRDLESDNFELDNITIDERDDEDQFKIDSEEED